MPNKILHETKKIMTTKRSGGSVFFKTKPAKLRLSDEKIFLGQVPGWQTEDSIGEVVFNTGMTGYVESLTDPSYAGQILVFTYPLIGNYGVSLASSESARIQVRGVIVSTAAQDWSHSGSDRSLLEWLQQQNIPILMGVDTRSLTKYLRTRGTMPGSFGTKPRLRIKQNDDTTFVTIDKPVTYNQTKKRRIILVDCGSKENILRSLLKLPISVTRVPFDYDYTKEEYDGVLISNGPGNPRDYKKTIAITRQTMKSSKPVFGICLGNQIMALAAGAKTYKLIYGHRGHNQPCSEEASRRCFMTSQNHGYAIREKSLPKTWKVSFRNLNDDSVEGIEHKNKPFFSVQFHPEASPGPTDTQWLFKKFYESL